MPGLLFALSFVMAFIADYLADYGFRGLSFAFCCMTILSLVAALLKYLEPSKQGG